MLLNPMHTNVRQTQSSCPAYHQLGINFCPLHPSSRCTWRDLYMTPSIPWNTNKLYVTCMHERCLMYGLTWRSCRHSYEATVSLDDALLINLHNAMQHWSLPPMCRSERVTSLCVTLGSNRAWYQVTFKLPCILVIVMHSTETSKLHTSFTACAAAVHMHCKAQPSPSMQCMCIASQI